MKNVKGAATCIVFILVLSWSALAQQNAVRVESMKLLAPDIGWASTDRQLFWTTDGGHHWKDITPKSTAPEVISTVFFLDTSRGWALLVHGGDDTHQPIFDIAFTASSGSDWSTTRVTLPQMAPGYTPLSGVGWLDFVDRAHGWIVLKFSTNAAVSFGLMLRTEDGGATWKALPQPPKADHFRFITQKDGWLAGNGDLYATRDAGNSWSEVSLKTPRQVLASSEATYGVPVFTDTNEGFLLVTYSETESVHSVLALFATRDGGTSWKVEQVLPNMEQTTVGETLPSAVLDSTLMVAVPSAGSLMLMKLTPGGGISSTTAHSSPSVWNVGDLSFVSSDYGWALASDKVLSTSNGGANWIDITPGIPSASSGTQAFKPLSQNFTPTPSGALSPNTVGNHVSTHLGIDMYSVATVARMQTWWNSSPYWDVAFYLPGSPNRHVDKGATAAWVSQVENQGWGIIPTWFGLQAPCTDNQNLSRFSLDPATASTQGAQEADNAAASALTTGLSGTIIYHDIEHYTPSAQCSPAVQAFLDGWINELHIQGFSAGAYGSANTASADFSQVSPLPDDVWIAKTPGAGKLPQLTIWGLTPLCDPYSANPCQLWSSDQRIHQYLITHYETWGGVTLSIDSDMEDATVAGGQGNKPFNFAVTTFSYPGSGTNSSIFPEGINNVSGTSIVSANGQVGQIVGQYQPPTGPYFGFLDTNGNFSAISYPGATGGTGAFGINDAGQIVGESETLGSPPVINGFLYSGGAFSRVVMNSNDLTYPIGINDAGQIAGDDSTLLVGFLDVRGVFTPISYPGATRTGISGINGATELSLGYALPGSSQSNSALDVRGTFTPISYPGASFTGVTAVNSNGEAVGEYNIPPLNGIDHAFLYSNGSYLNIDQPGATIYPLGINDFGQIVGQYFDNTCIACGFVASPQ